VIMISRQSFYAWFLTTRPWNVLAMGLVVVVTRHWLGLPLESLGSLGAFGWIAVPMLVGAGGNLINDYFDIREDRINKPSKARVGRTVKRRVVLVSHWGLNFVALLWSGWLSADVGHSWPLVLMGANTLALYFYSPKLKSRGAWGNLTVSASVASLLVWSALPLFHGELSIWEIPSGFWSLTALIGTLNMFREWVKDIQDLQGDRVAGHLTLAAKMSATQIRWTKPAVACLVAFAGGCWVYSTDGIGLHLGLWAVLSAGVIRESIIPQKQNLSAWLKASMAALICFLI